MIDSGLESKVRPDPCRWCGNTHGPHCPIVKAIEYFENGEVKRVEFVAPRDQVPDVSVARSNWNPIVLGGIGP